MSPRPAPSRLTSAIGKRAAAGALAAAALACLSPHAQAADTQVLAVQVLTTPSPSTSNTAYVWADEIATNNAFYAKELHDPPASGANAPFRAQSTVFQDGGRTIFASVALSSRTCESSGNGTGSSNVNHCASKVAVLQDGRLTTVPSEPACYIFDPNQRNQTTATYDARASTVTFSTTSAGVVVPDCSVTVSIPR